MKCSLSPEWAMTSQEWFNRLTLSLGIQITYPSVRAVMPAARCVWHSQNPPVGIALMKQEPTRYRYYVEALNANTSITFHIGFDNAPPDVSVTFWSHGAMDLEITDLHAVFEHAAEAADLTGIFLTKIMKNRF